MTSALTSGNDLYYRNALDKAAYALFQIKRMVGVTDDIREHAVEAHQAACKALDEAPPAPSEGRTPELSRADLHDIACRLEGEVRLGDEKMYAAKIRAVLQAPSATADAKDAARWRALKELAGYYQDGSQTTVKLYQDDALRSCFIEASGKTYGTDGSSFNSILDELTAPVDRGNGG